MMSFLPAKNKIFVDNGSEKRSHENFQYYKFSNLNFKEREKPISFYRSDFRGSNLDNVNFFRNDFRRADFNFASFYKCSFEESQLGPTGIHGSTFEQIIFKGNKHDTTFFTDCMFVGCKFIGESFLKIDMRNCKFINCIFDSCKFKMSTLDCNHFSSVHFQSIDFSSMYAVNLYFEHCEFVDFTIDIDYLCCYFFAFSDFSAISYKYKGRVVQVDLETIELIKEIAKHNIENNRIYEFFNSCILYSKLKDKFEKLGDLAKLSALKILKISSDSVRKYQLLHFFDALKFYMTKDDFPLQTALEILIHLDTVPTSDLSFEDLQLYELSLEYLKSNLLNIENKRQNPHPMFGIIKLKSENREESIEMLTDFFSEIASSLNSVKPSIVIHKCYKGSTIIEFLSSPVDMLAAFFVLKSIPEVAMKLYIQYKAVKKIGTLISSAQTLPDINQLTQSPMVKNLASIKGLETTKKLISQLIELQVFSNNSADGN